MLDETCILFSLMRTYTKYVSEELCESSVTIKNLASLYLSLRCEEDITICFLLNIAIILEDLHGSDYTRLGNTELVCYVCYSDSGCIQFL